MSHPQPKQGVFFQIFPAAKRTIANMGFNKLHFEDIENAVQK